MNLDAVRNKNIGPNELSKSSFHLKEVTNWLSVLFKRLKSYMKTDGKVQFSREILQ